LFCFEINAFSADSAEAKFIKAIKCFIVSHFGGIILILSILPKTPNSLVRISSVIKGDRLPYLYLKSK